VTVVPHPAGGLTVRRLTPAVIPGVRRVFRDTVALGRPLPFPVPGFAAYERLCLDWFLGPGWEDAAVLDDDAVVRGYVLVCTDLPAYRRWAARTAAAFALATTARLAGGRLSPEAARFYRLRLLDGIQALREGPAPPMPAVVHLNLDPGLRGGMEGLRLARHADRRCAAAGLPGWYGEINAPVGSRAAGLRRGGFQVVHRAPNHTLSWLAGRPVERLTVVRRLGGRAAAAGPDPSAAAAPAPVAPGVREAG
jgi:hypothetical protein